MLFFRSTIVGNKKKISGIALSQRDVPLGQHQQRADVKSRNENGSEKAGCSVHALKGKQTPRENQRTGMRVRNFAGGSSVVLSKAFPGRFIAFQGNNR